MSLRVDFLVDSEKRFQGRVGNRFIVVIGTATVLAVVLLTALFQAWVYRQAKQDIQKAAATLDVMMPRVARIKKAQAETALWKRYVEELGGWQESRTPVSRMLLRVQKAVPENMQILQMTLRDDLTAPARLEPRRVFRIRIAGRSVGPGAEQDVSRFIQKLNTPSGPDAPPFQSVTLLSIQAETGEGEVASRFEIEAAGPEQMLK